MNQRVDLVKLPHERSLFSNDGVRVAWICTGQCFLQLSTTEKIAAILGPASLLPICSQFLRPITIGRIEFSVQFTRRPDTA